MFNLFKKSQETKETEAKDGIEKFKDKKGIYSISLDYDLDSLILWAHWEGDVEYVRYEYSELKKAINDFKIMMKKVQ